MKPLSPLPPHRPTSARRTSSQVANCCLSAPHARSVFILVVFWLSIVCVSESSTLARLSPQVPLSSSRANFWSHHAGVQKNFGITFFFFNAGSSILDFFQFLLLILMLESLRARGWVLPAWCDSMVILFRKPTASHFGQLTEWACNAMRRVWAIFRRTCRHLRAE